MYLLLQYGLIAARFSFRCFLTSWYLRIFLHSEQLPPVEENILQDVEKYTTV